MGDALIGYLHSLTEHQGRKISSATIRERGYYPVGGRKRIDRIISSCIPFKGILERENVVYLSPSYYFAPPFSATIVIP